MNIRYYIRGSKELKNIYVRLMSKKLDVAAPVGVFVQEFEWDSVKEICKSVKTNQMLFKLKSNIISSYNDAYCTGQPIDTDWLQDVIKQTFNRPVQEEKMVSKSHTIYLLDFCKYWMENHAKSWKVAATQFMGENLRKQYDNFVSLLEDYEQKSRSKTKLKLADEDFIYSLIAYLQNEQKFSTATAKRNITRLKFFLRRADEMQFEVNKDYLKRIHFDPQPEIQDVYLSESDIKAIYDLRLEGGSRIEIARDNLILTCWLGLRISDFMTRFDAESISNGYVSIKTQKTGSFVTIPLHPMVKDILNKRMGCLPPKMSNTEHNLLIKTVAEKAGLNSVVYGKKHNPETNRKEKGYYKKSELVTSHTGRRSFATNLKGKVSDEIIIAAAGWSDGTMLAHYDKRNNMQFAETLKNYWDGN